MFLVLLLRGGMGKITAWYLLQLVMPALGLLGLLVVAANLIARRRLSRPAAAVGGLSLLALLPGLLLVAPVTYPASLEKTTPTATVRLPADAPLTVVWGGDSVAVNNHARTPDQRWAYDLVFMPAFSGSADVADYGCYGVPVLAPAAGVVSSAHDGEPDAVPGQVSNNTTAPLGNHVVIELPTGTYLAIAHLQPGSVAVQAGDEVVEGQIIGACGNSGNTSEPHIHIHHQRQNPADFPINFAEGLPLFFRDHVDADGQPGPAMPEGGVTIDGDVATAAGPTLRHAP